MNLQVLDITKQEVQDFLWEHMSPTDYREDYTKLDVLVWVRDLCFRGDAMLIGDLSVPFVFFAMKRNSEVVEPHIMGDGRYFRTAVREGLKLAGRFGFKRAVIWTQHESIARLAQRCGFTLHGAIPGLHLGGTIYCLGKEIEPETLLT